PSVVVVRQQPLKKVVLAVGDVLGDAARAYRSTDSDRGSEGSGTCRFECRPLGDLVGGIHECLGAIKDVSTLEGVVDLAGGNIHCGLCATCLALREYRATHAEGEVGNP